jgi:hypothetical protein
MGKTITNRTLVSRYHHGLDAGNYLRTSQSVEQGIYSEEAEQVVREAEIPYPRRIGEDKLLVWGAGRGAVCCR